MKRFLTFLQSRFFVLGLITVVQFLVLVLIVMKATAYGHMIAEACYVLSLLMVIWILSRDMHPTYKLAWVVPILAFPLLGGAFYLLFGTHGFKKDRLKKRAEPFLTSQEIRPQSLRSDTLQELKSCNSDAYLQAKFVRSVSGSPLYRNTQTQYFPSGESFFEQLLKDLHRARHFIFIESFIIEEGFMFDSLRKVLEEKASQGVEVRLLYDDVGSAPRVSSDFYKQLEKTGIKAAVFNARGLKLSFMLNNRDHRKIVVIDGDLGYMGGVNLADEYINKVTYFGHWKDAALRLKGDAAQSLVVFFLEMWGFATLTQEDEFTHFLSFSDHQAQLTTTPRAPELDQESSHQAYTLQELKIQRAGKKEARYASGQHRLMSLSHVKRTRGEGVQEDAQEGVQEYAQEDTREDGYQPTELSGQGSDEYKAGGLRDRINSTNDALECTEACDCASEIHDGFVLPYADSSPLTDIPVSKYSFMNAIQDAKESIYIMTPYLIIDAEIQTALTTAALMGIDVRIITPAIPDKKLVFEVTRANYVELVRSGVRIYEYTPGFIHSKTLVIDDTIAVIGTCNFDYRSFFLHFESGVWLCESSAVHELTDDFHKTFACSQEVTREDVDSIPLLRRMARSVLSAFAPLL